VLLLLYHDRVSHLSSEGQIANTIEIYMYLLNALVPMVNARGSKCCI